MKLKNNIKFDNHTEAWNCGRVLFRIPARWNQDIMKEIRFLYDKIFSKEENDDGTIRIRLTKEWTERHEYILKDSIHTVKNMYRDEYADAFMKLFSCSEED